MRKQINSLLPSPLFVMLLHCAGGIYWRLSIGKINKMRQKKNFFSEKKTLAIKNCKYIATYTLHKKPQYYFEKIQKRQKSHKNYLKEIIVV